MTVLLVKTFWNDKLRAKGLLRSVVVSAGEDFFVICIAEARCLNWLKSELGETVECDILFLDETELLSRKEINKYHGYILQQIVKLRYSSICDASFYFCMDSDLKWIAPLQKHLFADDEGRVRDFVLPDPDPLVDPAWKRKYDCQRGRYLDAIKNHFGLANMQTAHGMVSLKVDSARGLLAHAKSAFGDLGGMLTQAPMEFSWYFGFIQATGEKLNPCLSPVKTFHTANQYFAHLRLGASENDLAGAYSGYVLNANWASKLGVMAYGDKRSIAPFLTRWMIERI